MITFLVTHGPGFILIGYCLWWATLILLARIVTLKRFDKYED